jgi:hypothetical protein
MGLGKYALQIADKGLREAGIVPDPVKPEDTAADIPVVKAFIVRYPSASTESIQHFYDNYNTNKRYFDTFMAKAQEGDTVAMQRIYEMGGARMFVQLDDIKDTLAEHAKLIRTINKDPAYGPEKQRELIDQLYFRMTEIAREGVEAMRQADAALADITAGESPVPSSPAVPLPKRSGIREELRAAGFSAEEVAAYLRSAEGAAAAR